MDHFDHGDMTVAKGLPTGYLPQDGLTLSGNTVFHECMSVFADVQDPIHGGWIAAHGSDSRPRSPSSAEGPRPAPHSTGAQGRLGHLNRRGPNAKPNDAAVRADREHPGVGKVFVKRDDDRRVRLRPLEDLESEAPQSPTSAT